MSSWLVTLNPNCFVRKMQPGTLSRPSGASEGIGLATSWFRHIHPLARAVVFLSRSADGKIAGCVAGGRLAKTEPASWSSVEAGGGAADGAAGGLMGMWKRRDCANSSGGDGFDRVGTRLGFDAGGAAGYLQEVVVAAGGPSDGMGIQGLGMEATGNAMGMGFSPAGIGDGGSGGSGSGRGLWHHQQQGLVVVPKMEATGTQNVNAGYQNEVLVTENASEQQQFMVPWGRQFASDSGELGVGEAAGSASHDGLVGFQTAEEVGFGTQAKVVDEASQDGNVVQAAEFQNDYNGEAVDTEVTGVQYPELVVEKDGKPEAAFAETSEEDCDGTPDEQLAFVKGLEIFFRERNMEFKAPKFYGEELNCLKLWKAVMKLGGYEQVTGGKLWRQVGESFKPPKTCTTISWSFRGFYEKALLEYERHKTGVSVNQETGQPGDPSRASDNQDGLSLAASQPPSGSGRARRDAAARAMQGWHSQRSGNGEAGDSPIKSSQRREKRVKSSGLLKRKDGSGKGKSYLRENNLEDAHGISSFKKKAAKHELVKAAAKANLHSGIELEVIDEGPQADWVKINVHQTRDCFEVYALVPGLLREEVRIQCEVGGRLVIAGEPEQPDNPWGVTAFRKVINLPLRIDAHQTSAVVTLHGQLFIRVPFAQPESQQ